MKRMIVLLLILATGLLLAACGGQPTAEEVVTRMQAAFENTGSLHAMVEAEAAREGETIRVVGENWYRRVGEREQVRSEVREASDEKLAGTVAVNDGEIGWLYNPAAGTALTGRRADLEAYRAEQGGEMTADFESLKTLVEQALEISNVEMVGEAVVAERAAWHLRLTPNEQAPQAWQVAGGTVELWIDQQSDLPLQATYSGGPEAAGTGRVTVLELEENAAIADERFQWSPPAGTEVVDVATLLPQRMTLPEARAEAAFPLLSTPADTEQAALVELYRQGPRYVQTFDGRAGEWRLIQGPESSEGWYGEIGEGTTVSVRGTEGRTWSDPERGTTTLAWTENGATRVIAGKFSLETAQALAESLTP